MQTLESEGGLIMGYCYSDWRHKKLTVEREDGQFLFNYGESEINLANNLKDTAIQLREGASDEKDVAIRYIEHLTSLLENGKLEVKWNIS